GREKDAAPADPVSFRSLIGSLGRQVQFVGRHAHLSIPQAGTSQGVLGGVVACFVAFLFAWRGFVLVGGGTRRPQGGQRGERGRGAGGERLVARFVHQVGIPPALLPPPHVGHGGGLVVP